MQYISWGTTSYAKRHGIRLTDAVGLIPVFFSPSDPRTAQEQIEERYSHGGGWRPHPEPDKWQVDPTSLTIKYPGNPKDHEPDEVYHALAMAKLPNGQSVIVFECAWVLVAEPDGRHQIARMD